MTPTLQQAIKLLQMTRLELQDVVNQEIVANPVLEEEEASSEAAAEAAAAEDVTSPADTPEGGERTEGGESGDRSDGGDGADASEEGAAPGDAGAAAAPGEADRPPAEGESVPETPAEPDAGLFEQIDLESFFGDYMEGTASAPRMTEELEEYSLENRAEAPPDLADHLTEQLGLSDTPAGLREVCAFLIGNVDRDGYLRVTVEEVAQAVPCSLADAEKAVALLQSFDPVGVGARDLAECLLLQARAAGVATPLLVDLVTHRLAEIGSRPAPLLARLMGVPVEELTEAVGWIRKLDPKPGRMYDSSRTIYVEPDVAVVRSGDDYVVLFNDDGLPRLRVSSLYRRMLAADDGSLDGDGRSYLREKMRAAQWLMKSLDQRKRTIVRVAESIVKKQRDFLDYGVAHLRPLVLRDVAEDIGMHESTVSRVVSNKWIATPRGLLPMKFFFHSAIASSGGEDVSSLAVKGKIRDLVESEDPTLPLSDARLSELLSREGIRIARRTVAKYREELRIPASSIRKAGVPVGRAGACEPVGERPPGPNHRPTVEEEE